MAIGSRDVSDPTLGTPTSKGINKQRRTLKRIRLFLKKVSVTLCRVRLRQIPCEHLQI